MTHHTEVRLNPDDSTPAATACPECRGSGLVETCTFGIGLHEIRCVAEGCDDGLIRD